MDISEVIALSKAGFTSDQIMQMAQAQAFQAPQPQPQQMQQIPQVSQQMPQQISQQLPQQMLQPQLMQQVQVPGQMPQVQTPAPSPEQQKNPFDQLFEQMTGIKQAIQTSNIQNSQMTPAAPQTTDDILASIIQPTKPKEDK